MKYLIICLLLLSCKEITKYKWNTYYIDKDKHYSGVHTIPFRSNRLNFLVRFDESSIYTCSNPTNQGDINKLYGFSDCGKAHHESSARIGWRYYNNKLQLFSYTYNNGKATNHYLKNVEINTDIHCSININSNNYVYCVLDTCITITRDCIDLDYTNYKLYPFFGGQETPDHTITIKIKELK